MDIERRDVRARRRVKRTRIAAAGVLLGAVVLAALHFVRGVPGVEKDKIWRGVVRRGPLVQQVAASGTLVSRELRAITNQSEGVVERILTLPGRPVQPDSVLVVLSSPQLEESLARAQRDLLGAAADASASRIDLQNQRRDAEVDVASAESDYSSALLDLQAKERIPGVIPQLEIERARIKMQELSKRLDAQRARSATFAQYQRAREHATTAHLDQLRHDVASLQTQVANLQVRAGMQGVVQEINVQEGAHLAVGEAVARVVNPSALLARLSVAEQDAGVIRAGLGVSLIISAQNARATVVRVDPTVRDELVTVDAELATPLPKDMRPDLSVNGQIEVARIPDTLVLERPVAVRREAERIDLYRLDRNGATAERVEVRIGRVSVREVEITAGLKAGDEVILSEVQGIEQRPRIQLD